MQAAAEALVQIGKLYEIEEEIRKAKLSGDAKRMHRLTHSKPRVDGFSPGSSSDSSSKACS